MHDFGPDSNETNKLIKERNKKVKELCQDLEDTIVFVIADHGHIKVNNLFLNDYPSLKIMLERNTSIEQRTISFKVKDGMHKSFEEEFNKLLGNYFTLYKNDELDPKMKGPLLFLVLQLLNRKNQLDTNKNLSMLEREELINQIGDLYQYNFNLLCTNREVISDVWREYVKISVKYALQLPVYDFHFFGVKEKTDEDIMELIDKDLDILFEEYKSFDIRDIDTEKYVEDAIKMLQIEALV